MDRNMIQSVVDLLFQITFQFLTIPTTQIWWPTILVNHSRFRMIQLGKGNDLVKGYCIMKNIIAFHILQLIHEVLWAFWGWLQSLSVRRHSKLMREVSREISRKTALNRHEIALKSACERLSSKVWKSSCTATEPGNLVVGWVGFAKIPNLLIKASLRIKHGSKFVIWIFSCRLKFWRVLLAGVASCHRPMILFCKSLHQIIAIQTSTNSLHF